MKHLLFALLLIGPSTLTAQHRHSQKLTRAELIPGLGSINHPVSTKDREAQKFFNQGLAALYGFNHEEAVRSFKRAAAIDSQLAIAYWGIALVMGSNYNIAAERPQLLEAYLNLQKARALSSQASPSERSYIEALSKRYSEDLEADQQKLATDYKDAMKELTQRYPEDLDAATLYAESLMNLRPWRLWANDGRAAEGTDEIVSVLESVLRRNPNHPGANHYYIHAVEASKNPERALASATRLANLAPTSGHLVHMPSHIYVRTGDYEKAVQSNANALLVDREYIAKTGAKGVYTMYYLNHNVHFLSSLHAMQGRFRKAIATAVKLESDSKLHVSGMPMLEMFMPNRLVVLTRFGRWDLILRTAKPETSLKTTTGFWHFARGMAFCGVKKAANAEFELAALQAVMRDMPSDATFSNNSARDVLMVAEKTLMGKIALANGDKKSAFETLAKAVADEDHLVYNEPADWDLPVRELLGAALLLNGDYLAAENVFRAENAKHPRNGRALFGLAASLRAQGKNSEAQKVQKEFKRTWASADTRLTVVGLVGIRS